MKEIKPNFDTRETRLRFAVRLTDDFTGKAPVGNVKIHLEEDPETEANMNRSGYYLFVDLTKSQYHIVVESDYYYQKRKRVRINQLEPRSPVVKLELIPKPNYPFPTTATLIRGTVKDTDGNPITDGKVRINGRGISARTNEKGDFVVYIK